MAKPAQKRWSPRSQRSLLEQEKLEGELQKLQLMISLCEKRIAKEQTSVDSLVSGSITNQPTSALYIGQHVAVLENERREVAAYQAHKVSLEAKIKALAHPTSSQAAQRGRQQSLLAKKVKERLAKDRQIDATLEIALQLLNARQKLTSEIQALASAIDLTLAPDGLDERRFEVLLDSLPADLASESERWLASFTGEKRGTATYSVEVDRLVLDETLASSGVYHCGERVALTDEQASKVLSRAERNSTPILAVGAKGRAQEEEPVAVAASESAAHAPVTRQVGHLRITEAPARQVGHVVLGDKEGITA